MKRAVIGTIVAAAALALAVTPAQAAGTVHVDYPKDCDTYPDDADGYLSVCYGSSYQYNDVVTPSGNGSVVVRGTSTYSVTTAHSSYSNTFSYKLHTLIKPGEVQVDRLRSSETFPFDGTTCTVTQSYHYANGAVRHDKPTFRCSP